MRTQIKQKGSLCERPQLSQKGLIQSPSIPEASVSFTEETDQLGPRWI